MTIGELNSLNIYDGNEQIVVLSGDITDPKIEYSGKLVDTPDAVKEYKILQVSAVGEVRREALQLNKFGWTEIWIAE